MECAGIHEAGGGTVGFYKSVDGGEHWKLAVAEAGSNRAPDNRPLVRIGALSYGIYLFHMMQVQRYGSLQDTFLNFEGFR